MPDVLSSPGVVPLLWLAPVPLAALWAAVAAGRRSRRDRRRSEDRLWGHVAPRTGLDRRVR